MSRYGFFECLAWSEVDGTAVATTAKGSLIPPNALYPAGAGGTFWDVGKKVRMEAEGRISNIVTTPGTFQIFAMVGAVNVFTSQAIALNIIAKTNVSWNMYLKLTCRSIGSGTAATIMGQGRIETESLVIPVAGWIAGNPSAMNMPASAPAVGTGFDSSAAANIDLQAQFSLTGNSMTCHQYSLWAEN